MTSVAGLDAVTLAPTGADSLVDQLNHADRFPKWTLLSALSIGLIGAGIDSALLPGIGLVVLAALVAVAAAVLYRKESIENLVPVEYTLEGETPGWVASLEQTWKKLQGLGGAWRIVESGKVQTLHQLKTNAGASHLVNRVKASFSTASPKVLTTNITVPSVASGSTRLYFLPDRVLVRTGRRWTDVGYQHLRVDLHHQRFVEEGSLPRDGTKVDTTWKYVNKGGGPDRRFKDNRQLPVMLYGRVSLSSSQGLSWVLDLSVTGVADAFAACLRRHPS